MSNEEIIKKQKDLLYLVIKLSEKINTPIDDTDQQVYIMEG
ncbi:hypothetical protein [Clostridium tagluense]|uniref:Uncharacterized protein n=1 Tax=Clostridium tagluense TaxID=360422 RepID=A0A401UTA7_9CLOT|nr:hypothetical protein [Clostridium tagluense]GCD12688.1 hypothetical protein Ctaglu_43110 [Clostridium tagluense]